MTFCEKLNNYIEQLECSSQELANASGLSSAVISRYRNGERTPNIKSKKLESLSNGLYKISVDRKELWRQQNTEKKTFCVGVGIAVMKAAAVYKNALAGLQGDFLTVDVIRHLPLQNQNEFEIVMPVADRTKIRIA